ncbi:MAG: 5-formyltetrahydrofolate cyclo-ligase [Oscillospiraceae bacterium]|nr:5-formyltetrahydrofolate cyclo-ligase [Oscillospiraceae bacterium]
MDSKSILRKQYKLRRASLFVSDADKKKADDAIKEYFISLKKSHNISVFLVYVSFRDEVDTKELIEYLLSSGGKVAVPRCYDNGRMEFFVISSLENLRTSAYGILEPEDDERFRVTDFENSLCIVPGLAFDSSGMRIGYGGGYYDRFLEKHENMISVGFCYDSLIEKSVLTEKHDRKVDYIITEKGIMRTNG